MKDDTCEITWSSFLQAISVEGPSKATIDLADRKDGSCFVKYQVSEPGEYRVGIRFDDDIVPGSPFAVTYFCHLLLKLVSKVFLFYRSTLALTLEMRRKWKLDR
jgi:hypothetical protein